MALTNIENLDLSTELADYSVPGEMFNIVRVWFENKNFTKSAADLLATALIKTVIDNNGTQADLMDILKTYQSTGAAQMTQFTAFLLNNSRLPTSFVGYESPQPANKVFNRLII